MKWGSANRSEIYKPYTSVDFAGMINSKEHIWSGCFVKICLEIVFIVVVVIRGDKKLFVLLKADVSDRLS